MGDPRELGRLGEDAALAYLERQGMVLVTRNWRCRSGEVDLVVRDGPTLVLCEVKTRSGLGFGPPLAAITATKRARLRRLAALYLQESGGYAGPVRIDAVGILWGADSLLRLEHVRAAA